MASSTPIDVVTDSTSQLLVSRVGDLLRTQQSADQVGRRAKEERRRITQTLLQQCANEFYVLAIRTANAFLSEQRKAQQEVDAIKSIPEKERTSAQKKTLEKHASLLSRGFTKMKAIPRAEFKFEGRNAEGEQVKALPHGVLTHHAYISLLRPADQVDPTPLDDPEDEYLRTHEDPTDPECTRPYEMLIKGVRLFNNGQVTYNTTRLPNGLSAIELVNRRLLSEDTGLYCSMWESTSPEIMMGPNGPQKVIRSTKDGKEYTSTIRFMNIAVIWDLEKWKGFKESLVEKRKKPVTLDEFQQREKKAAIPVGFEPPKQRRVARARQAEPSSPPPAPTTNNFAALTVDDEED